jgi:hypothetical protein
VTSDIDPQAKAALLRAGQRGLQMVLRLLAHNAEHWLSSHLNAYLRDDDEYRAITRETIIRGLWSSDAAPGVAEVSDHFQSPAPAGTCIKVRHPRPGWHHRV